MRSKVSPELQPRSPDRLLRSSSRRQISSAVPSCTATGGVSAWLMGSRKEMSVRCPGTYVRLSAPSSLPEASLCEAEALTCGSCSSWASLQVQQEAGGTVPQARHCLPATLQAVKHGCRIARCAGYFTPI